jgi:hypothetical protein
MEVVDATHDAPPSALRIILFPVPLEATATKLFPLLAMCDHSLLKLDPISRNDHVTPPSTLLAILFRPELATATTVLPFAATPDHTLFVDGPTGNLRNFAILLS